MKDGTTLSRVAACAGALALGGCVTINVYFPEAAIQDLSEQIEDRVRERAEELEGEGGRGAGADGESRGSSEPAPAPSSRLRLLIQSGSVPSPEITNPAIRAIIDSRARRLSELDRFKSLGVIGEANDANVEILDLGALESLADRAKVKRLVEAENQDRERLFREIAKAKDVDASQIPRIRQTYAETLRQHARPGHWIETPDGEWVQAK